PRVVRLTEAGGDERSETRDDDEHAAALTHRGRDRGATVVRERERLRADRQRADPIDGDAAGRRIGEDGVRERMRAGDRDAVDADVEGVEQRTLKDPGVG